MEELFLPVLSHFQNGNAWTGSAGRLRYRVVPEEELCAQVWEGPWCYQLSRVEETQRFPLEEEGLEKLADWLQAWRVQIEARPHRTLEQTIQDRDALRAEREAEAAEKD
jgi:hypothetical protein